VKTTSGAPVSGVKIDVWETDSHGKYDVQYADRGDNADGRAVVESDAEGVFWFKAIVPVPYPIPNDGPVGKLLEKLGRHCWRPSHMHFMFEKGGFDHLVTYVSLSFPFLNFLSSFAVFIMYFTNEITAPYTSVAQTTRPQTQSLASRTRSS
jgi:hypothetical protein